MDAMIDPPRTRAELLAFIEQLETLRDTISNADSGIRNARAYLELLDEFGVDALSEIKPADPAETSRVARRRGRLGD